MKFSLILLKVDLVDFFRGDLHLGLITFSFWPGAWAWAKTGSCILPDIIDRYYPQGDSLNILSAVGSTAKCMTKSERLKKKKKKRSETATRRYGRLYSCVGIKKMLDILPAWSIKLSENRKCYKFPPSRHTQLPCTHMPVLSGRQSIFFLFVKTIIQDWMIE